MKHMLRGGDCRSLFGMVGVCFHKGVMNVARRKLLCTKSPYCSHLRCFGYLVVWSFFVVHFFFSFFPVLVYKFPAHTCRDHLFHWNSLPIQMTLSPPCKLTQQHSKLKIELNYLPPIRPFFSLLLHLRYSLFSFSTLYTFTILVTFFPALRYPLSSHVRAPTS